MSKGFKQQVPFQTVKRYTQKTRAEEKVGKFMLYFRCRQENTCFILHSQGTLQHHQHEMQQNCCNCERVANFTT